MPECPLQSPPHRADLKIQSGLPRNTAERLPLGILLELSYLLEEIRTGHAARLSLCASSNASTFSGASSSLKETETLGINGRTGPELGPDSC